MEKKMTAVRWLEQELNRIDRVYNLDEQKSYANEKKIEAFQQALSMELEQMEQSFTAGRVKDGVDYFYAYEDFTDYFTQNYKS